MAAVPGSGSGLVEAGLQIVAKKDNLPPSSPPEEERLAAPEPVVATADEEEEESQGAESGLPREPCVAATHRPRPANTPTCDPGRLTKETTLPRIPQATSLNGTVAVEDRKPSSALESRSPTETDGGLEEGRGGGGEEEEDLETEASMSGEQRPSSDSASYSVPSLELSEGTPPLDDPMSSSYSVLGVEGCSPSAELPYLAEEPLAGAAGALPATGGAIAAVQEPQCSMPAYYLVKWITWKEKKTPIITQSENGPCPLLAIMNTMFLRWKAKLPAQTEVVTTEDLMSHLGECVLSIEPRQKADGMELNFQQNMGDAMAVLPKLSTGLDVNVRFTGVADFEYTPECIVFDLLDIPLYHGWLLDPQSPEMVTAVGKLSYNQLVEKIINYKHSSESSRISEGLVAEQFLESTATQLSYHGLCELNATAKEGEISVFFRNNHFSTMIKHKGHLYLLVTDQGFLQEESLVWESLHNVEGDGNFCDSEFRLCHPPRVQTPAPSQRQIDQDYLVAMSLQQQQGAAPGPLSDLELARQLQQEEYHQQQQQQQQGPSQPPPPLPQQATQPVRGQAASQQGGRRERREKDSDCAIL